MSLPQINRFKIGLQAIPPYQKTTEQCRNCSKHFDEEFTQINNAIKNLQELIVNQNHVIMKCMADQKVLMERMLHQEITNNNLPSTFPIKNLNELHELNSSINESNRKAYVNTMKSLLKGKLPKTLTQIISTNLCMEINLDGIHGKEKLKSFEIFFRALTDACRSVGSQDVEKDIRMALKTIKKRFIHSQCIKKKNISLEKSMVE